MYCKMNVVSHSGTRTTVNVPCMLQQLETIHVVYVGYTMRSIVTSAIAVPRIFYFLRTTCIASYTR